jgi:hypothetical protein
MSTPQERSTLVYEWARKTVTINAELSDIHDQIHELKRKLRVKEGDLHEAEW